MATLRGLKRSIAGVDKIHHITSAMKIVASVRVKKAQNALFAMRPYSDRLIEMISRLISFEEKPHPLLEEKEEGRILIVVFTSDKGLCGAFNTNIIRKTMDVIGAFEVGGEKVDIIAVGKKGRDYFRKHGLSLIAEYTGFQPKIKYEDAIAIGDIIVDSFITGRYREVMSVYHQYFSAGRQITLEKSILPIRVEKVPELLPKTEYIYEPDRKSILDVILPMYVNVVIWRILQESTASEHGARMTAMDNATRNCEEIREKLSLQYHKVRQSSITMELLDIIGTSEAIK
ncbi:MAG: ATP synthase F1 subunit gamma [bacterium]